MALLASTKNQPIFSKFLLRVNRDVRKTACEAASKRASKRASARSFRELRLDLLDGFIVRREHEIYCHELRSGIVLSEIAIERPFRTTAATATDTNRHKQCECENASSSERERERELLDFVVL